MIFRCDRNHVAIEWNIVDVCPLCLQLDLVSHRESEIERLQAELSEWSAGRKASPAILDEFHTLRTRIRELEDLLRKADISCRQYAAELKQCHAQRETFWAERLAGLERVAALEDAMRRREGGAG